MLSSLMAVLDVFSFELFHIIPAECIAGQRLGSDAALRRARCDQRK